eukprot:1156381-Prymnesium_polylepis.1
MADMEGKGPIKTATTRSSYINCLGCSLARSMASGPYSTVTSKVCACSAKKFRADGPGCAVQPRTSARASPSQRRNGRPKTAWAPRQRTRRSSIRAPTAR